MPGKLLGLSRHRAFRLRTYRSTPLKFLRVNPHWYTTQTPNAPSKPYYVTTPIFYVNAAPHIGHLYALILADILKRWQVLKGRRALFCTGTDEHGMKVQQAAAKASTDVKVFCNQVAGLFKTLAERANISNDFFIRTTDSDHQEVVKYVWQLLEHRGYIYPSKHEGWYSVSDETFYPQSAVLLVQDARTGRKMMTSMETGTEVEWTSESNYHFRLSAFRDRLLDFYKANPEFTIPAVAMKTVVNSVTEGLKDLSISRPTSRLSWGIRVPGDESQTMYVWIDALVNYLTKAKYPWPPGEDHVGGWPADVHVIGKEILRFHCIYWPALLMALELDPPRRVLSHAHWTLGYKKMSKSTGNVVNPFFALERFGADTMRYYMAHDGGMLHDSDYGNLTIIERYKKGLQDGLGNLTSRILRGKRWSVREAVQLASRGELPQLDPIDLLHHWRLNELASKADEAVEELDVGKALRSIMATIFETNRYLQSRSPWNLVKAKTDTAKDHVNMIVYTCAETLRICGILLQPFMPHKAGELLDMLGVSRENRGFAQATIGADRDYGDSMVDLGKGHENVLFPPLNSDF